MILVRNLKLGISEDEAKLVKLAARELRVFEHEIKNLRITKKSLDARKKNDIHRLYSVAVELRDEKRALARTKSKNVCPYEQFEYLIPRAKSEKRPVIVGSDRAECLRHLCCRWRDSSP